jgi:serine/threonine protein kinase/Tol biopolymer transport system component
LFLAERCAGRRDLQAEVEALLRAHERTASALEVPLTSQARLKASTRLGSYEVLSELGAGSMGEVYRARDTRLGRDVAIKVLPTLFLSDPERRARLEREARVLASLNHPHIAAIYGVEEAGITLALVLELVEGETLAERIARGGGPKGPPLRLHERSAWSSDPAIPVAEALDIARQIADALEAAHEKGIVHRDLKPANINVTADGRVKVLDFGLAKALDTVVPTDQDVTLSPTITSAAMMTGVGMLLGTAAYMSPEQATGKSADKRSDIWAFGCVLYEMLTGRRAFDGDDITEVLAAVLRSEPDWSALPANTPAPIRRLLRRCLEKDRRHRAESAADARLDIEEAQSAENVVTPASANALSRREVRGAWVAFALAMVTATAFSIPAIRHLRETPATAESETRTEIVTPTTVDAISFALAPDGQHIAFVASQSGIARLMLRPLASAAVESLPGTDGAQFPFWSPDSRSIAFFADGRLKRVDLDSRTAQTLADAVPRGGTWNRDGIILLGRNNGPLSRVSASGGQTTPAVKLGPGQGSHRFPSFLPDGRRFLYYVMGAPEVTGIYLGALDSEVSKRLTPADGSGIYTPTNWLLFPQQGALVARRLDLEREELTGDPVTVANGISIDATTTATAISVAPNGLVAYRAGGAGRRQLAWFDRSGKMLGAVGSPDEGTPSFPRISPNGRTVAIHRTVQGNTDVWLADPVRMTRFTFNTSLDRFASWSPDGAWIAFDSNRKGHRDLYQKASNGAGSELVLLETAQEKTTYSWSGDGRFLLYGFQDPKTGFDLWVLPVQGDREPFAFVNAGFDQRQGAFSPDSRWIAYGSNESGRFEIYVRRFLGPTDAIAPSGASGQWQVSASGGIWPQWSANGKELYYMAPDSTLMAAPVTVGADMFNVGTPIRLFQTRIVGGGIAIDEGRQYDAARDGRFLINTVVDDTASSTITLIQNWRPPQK